MHIANAVLLLTTALVMFIVAFAVTDDQSDFFMGMTISVIPITSLVLGLLQLTMPSRGMHITVGTWLCVLGLCSAVCAFINFDQGKQYYILGFLFTACLLALGGMGVLQFIYVV